MSQTERLEKYCIKSLLPYEIEDGVLLLEEKYYYILDDVLIFNEEMEFLPLKSHPLTEEIDGYVYEFGGRWYLQMKEEEIKLNELKYIGKAIEKLPTEAFLGIRSGYELRNGIGLYSEWVKKAKFLGCKSLGICERSTLSGVLLFQVECKSNGIHPIIGMTVPVQGVEQFDIKIYAKDFQGWTNLLKFNAKLNVKQDMSIEKEFFEENSEGLFVVADPKSMNFEDAPNCVDYYQLETVTFINEMKDAWFVDNLEKFIKSDIEPISITDAFYLEQKDYITREYLWAIAKAFDDKTNNQYFKSKTEYVHELVRMFGEGNTMWVELYKRATSNEEFLAKSCTFQYDTDTRHLPTYKMSEKEEAEFDNKEDLFIHLIKKGFKDKDITDNKYVERVQEEIRVLRKGDVIDYFLVLHDIIGYAKEKNLLTGIGRGSAGGSLVSYLLGLIQIDPLEFDLLFERFLNDGRMGEYEDRDSYDIEGEDGKTITLAEGALIKIIREDKDRTIRVEELIEGDEIVKY